MTRGRGRSFWYGVGAAAGVLILVAGWFLAISPQLSAASDAEDEAAALQVTNQAQRASIANLQKVQPAPLRASLAEAVAGLPYDSALPAFTRQLTRQAQQHAVRVDSIVVGTPTSVGGTDPAATTASTLLSIPVTVGSSGTGANQRAFLKALQTEGPRHALVTTVALTPTDGDDGTVSGRSQMTTSTTVYVAPLDEVAQQRLDALLAGGAGTS